MSDDEPLLTVRCPGGRDGSRRGRGACWLATVAPRGAYLRLVTSTRTPTGASLSADDDAVDDIWLQHMEKRAAGTAVFDRTGRMDGGGRIEERSWTAECRHGDFAVSGGQVWSAISARRRVVSLDEMDAGAPR